MVFITGDLHGVIDYDKLNKLNTEGLTKKDYLIICGDFGGVWDLGKNDKFIQSFLNKQPYTTLFVDGNHDCVHKDSDILTDSGWVNIADAYNSNLKIANFDIETKEIFFDYPLNKIKSYHKEAIILEGKYMKQIVSLNHDVVIDNKKVKAYKLLGQKIKENKFIMKGNCKTNGVEITDNMIKLLTWTIMDGTILDESIKNPNSKKCRIQFKLAKPRKIKELTRLLDEMDFPYTFKKTIKSKIGKLTPYYIRIYSDTARYINKCLNGVKKIPSEWRNFNKEQVNVFLDTLIHTDGYKKKYGDIDWRTIDNDNVDIVQEFCIRNQISCKYKTLENASGFKNGKVQHESTISYNGIPISYINIEKINYDDDMYCFTMPHGTLITRMDNKIAFTGNCFPEINKYPIHLWNGGKIHKISKSIYHLMRGQIFTIDNKKFFTMGGAYSIDRKYRVKNVSWWEDELPNQKEYDEAMLNLNNHNWEVDYILTHTITSNIIRLFGFIPQDEKLNTFFDDLEGRLNYKHWYFGHFHMDKRLDDKHTVLYDRIIEL